MRYALERIYASFQSFSCKLIFNSLSGGNKGISRVQAALGDDGKYDFTSDAMSMIKTAQNCYGKCAFGSIILILKGSNAQRVKSHWKTLPTFGSGKHRNDSYWKALGKMLVSEGYLTETIQNSGKQTGRGGWQKWNSGFSYESVAVTREGEHALRNPNQKLCLKPSSVMLEELRYIIKLDRPTVDKANSQKPFSRIFNPSDYLVQKPRSVLQHSSSKNAKEETGSNTEDALKDTGTPVDPRVEQVKVDLYSSLVKLRSQIALDIGYMPYLIATNRMLLNMTEARPVTLAALRKVEGMLEAKVQKFGLTIIKHIKKFCEENGLDYNDDGDRAEEVHTSTAYVPRRDLIKNEIVSSTGWLGGETRIKTTSSVSSTSWLGGDTKSKTESIVSTHNSPDDRQSQNLSLINSSSLKSDNDVITEERMSGFSANSEPSDRQLSGGGDLEVHITKGNVDSSHKSTKETVARKNEDSDFFDSDDDSWVIKSKRSGTLSQGNLRHEVPSLSEKYVPVLCDKYSPPVREKLFQTSEESISRQKEAVKFDSTRTFEQLEKKDDSECASSPIFRSLSTHESSSKSCLSQVEVKPESKRKKIVYSDSESDTEESPLKKSASSTSCSSVDKYERIRQDNLKRVQSGGWIDARKMKEKMKKSSLFKK
ncbi:hypothetical protein SK128_022775 [Halocaridina rubra]|uniref:DNA 3'-5' helicase n=1 Tax=Halocaridina rubra TaxID=373956 RepID=A0AAN9AEK0_HALRR